MPRFDTAVITRTGEAQVVNVARPGTMLAFTAAHPGKDRPESEAELYWCAHHALGVDTPLAEWVDTLETVSVYSADVALARAIIAGDDHARDVALGRAEPDDDLVRRIEAAQLAEMGVTTPVDAGAPPDPTDGHAAPATRGGTRSPA